MLNDRDESDKYDNQDDTEYHFSDEEVSYEVEPDASKPVADKPKQNILNRLSSSKRMLLSGGIFIVLLFVIYKMIGPNNTTPSTDITAVTPPPTKTLPVAKPTPVTPPIQTASPVATTPPPVTLPPFNQPPAANVQPQAQPMPPQPTPPTQTVGNPNLPPAPLNNQVNNNQVPLANMPPPQTLPPTTMQPSTTTYPTTAVPQNDTQRLMAQVQSDYAQKFSEYVAQNKALQDQMQALNTRVATLEGQLNQLVQMLTKNQGAANPSSNMTAPNANDAAVEPNIAYNVQAIIPGRAWLRSENGDTVTVAEGDMIKDLGRVTKIDPYNGVVEINTGNKVVSLSYGAGS